MTTKNQAALQRARTMGAPKKAPQSSNLLSTKAKRSSPTKSDSIVERLWSPIQSRVDGSRSSGTMGTLIDPRKNKKNAAKEIQRIARGRLAKLSKNAAFAKKKQDSLELARKRDHTKQAKAAEEIQRIARGRQAKLSKKALQADKSQRIDKAARKLQAVLRKQFSKRQFESMEHASKRSESMNRPVSPRRSSMNRPVSPRRSSMARAVSPPATPRLRTISNRMSPTPMWSLSDRATPPTNKSRVSASTPEWLNDASEKVRQLDPPSRMTDEEINRIRRLEDTGQSLLASKKLQVKNDFQEFKMAAKAGKIPGVNWKALDGMQRCSPKAKRNAQQYCCQSDKVFDKKLGKFRQCQKTLTAEDFKRGETMCSSHRNLGHSK